MMWCVDQLIQLLVGNVLISFPELLQTISELGYVFFFVLIVFVLIDNLEWRNFSATIFSAKRMFILSLF